MANQNIKDLSIQVSLNGLSFCMYNKSSNEIVYLNALKFEKLLPFELLNKLKEELSTNTHFSDNFQNVQVIHYNNLSTIVPKALYQESNNADYLKYNTKILKTDFIAQDVSESEDMVTVYVPYMNINNYIFETFGAFTYKHASTLFLNGVLKLHRKDGQQYMYIDINQNKMIVAVVQNNNLILHNHFEFSTPEDFIYYTLFTAEQLQLDTDKFELLFSGTITKDNPLFAMAYKYVRHVDFIKSEAPKLLNLVKGEEAHQNYIIKQSF